MNLSNVRHNHLQQQESFRLFQMATFAAQNYLPMFKKNLSRMALMIFMHRPLLSSLQQIQGPLFIMVLVEM
jgi:hypothetical protein